MHITLPRGLLYYSTQYTWLQALGGDCNFYEPWISPTPGQNPLLGYPAYSPDQVASQGVFWSGLVRRVAFCHFWGFLKLQFLSQRSLKNLDRFYFGSTCFRIHVVQKPKMSGNQS